MLPENNPDDFTLWTRDRLISLVEAKNAIIERQFALLADMVKFQPPAPIEIKLSPEQVESFKAALAQMKYESPRPLEVVPSRGDQAELDRLRGWLKKIQSFVRTFSPTRANSAAIDEMTQDALAGKSP